MNDKLINIAAMLGMNRAYCVAAWQAASRTPTLQPDQAKEGGA